jgi:hypothetical protein
MPVEYRSPVSDIEYTNDKKFPETRSHGHENRVRNPVHLPGLLSRERNCQQDPPRSLQGSPGLLLHEMPEPLLRGYPVRKSPGGASPGALTHWMPPGKIIPDGKPRETTVIFFGSGSRLLPDASGIAGNGPVRPANRQNRRYAFAANRPEDREQDAVAGIPFRENLSPERLPLSMVLSTGSRSIHVCHRDTKTNHAHVTRLHIMKHTRARTGSASWRMPGTIP